MTIDSLRLQVEEIYDINQPRLLLDRSKAPCPANLSARKHDLNDIGNSGSEYREDLIREKI